MTDAVTRPVVAATTIGVARRSDLREKRAVRAGDRILLTKGLAVEGAALLARELGERLRALGMSDAELAACRDLLDRVSIVPEARIAAGFAGVRAMHDVTEGGLATALRELASAAGRGDRRARRTRAGAPRDRAPLRPPRRRPAGPHRLGQPAHLLRSGRGGGAESAARAKRGSPPRTSASSAARVRIAARPAADPGALAAVAALRDGRPVPWPEFAVDEAARILADEAGVAASRPEHD